MGDRLLAPTVYAPHVPDLRELVDDIERQCDGTAAGFARKAVEEIHRRFRYEKGATHVQSSIEDVIGAGAGVCQDFAHLLLAVLRMRGLPARYVSGYLVPRTTAEPNANQRAGLARLGRGVRAGSGLGGARPRARARSVPRSAVHAEQLERGSTPRSGAKCACVDGGIKRQQFWRP